MINKMLTNLKQQYFPYDFPVIAHDFHWENSSSMLQPKHFFMPLLSTRGSHELDISQKRFQFSEVPIARLSSFTITNERNLQKSLPQGYVAISSTYSQRYPTLAIFNKI